MAICEVAVRYSVERTWGTYREYSHRKHEAIIPAKLPNVECPTIQAKDTCGEGKHKERERDAI
jgi:hypothetical protein